MDLVNFGMLLALAVVLFVAGVALWWVWEPRSPSPTRTLALIINHGLAITKSETTEYGRIIWLSGRGFEVQYELAVFPRVCVQEARFYFGTDHSARVGSHFIFNDGKLKQWTQDGVMCYLPEKDEGQIHYFLRRDIQNLLEKLEKAGGLTAAA